jgi:thioredoxin-related protein
MGTPLKIVAVGLVLLIASHGAGKSAVDAHAVGQPAARELLVFEETDCTYCRVFRQDVLPYYRQAVPGDAVPLRFVDLSRAMKGEFALKGRIQAVPTVVLMKNGSEVGRIVGYWGRDTFFRLLSHLLARME